MTTRQEKEDQFNVAYITGTCTYMCPEKERIKREQEGLIHLLELPPGDKSNKHAKADHNLMIKCFSRSAAGQHSPQPNELRPPETLYKTVCHLLTNIAERQDVEWSVVYDFIFDRLRAVRQDMVIQGLSDQYCIKILEPIVRFHAYSGYRLCEEPLCRFDPVINRTHMLECLKRLLVFYDMMESSDSVYSNEKSEDGKQNSNKSTLVCSYSGAADNEERGIKLASRMEMEAAYLLTAMGECDALSRTLRLKDYRNPISLQTALSMSLTARNGNFVRICRLLPQLPPLLACIAAQHLPSIRRHALQVMSTAYSCRNLRYPLPKLQTLLLYWNADQTRADCAACGIAVEDNTVMFSKSSFITNAATNKTVRVKAVEEMLKLTHPSQLLLFGSQCSAMK